VQPIRILIVDDHALFCEGLASLLNLKEEIEVTGIAYNGREALEKVSQQRPDVVLLDVRMPGMSGISVAREITSRFPATRVIVLTTFDDDEYIFQALRAGASGYLLKTADSDFLVHAIKSAHAGHSVLEPTVTEKVIRRTLQQQGTEQVHYAERLSHREKEVLNLMAEGLGNSEIGEKLSLAEGTVKNHVSRIIAKLSARDRTHAVRLAVEWGLLND